MSIQNLRLVATKANPEFILKFILRGVDGSLLEGSRKYPSGTTFKDVEELEEALWTGELYRLRGKVKWFPGQEASPASQRALASLIGG